VLIVEQNVNTNVPKVPVKKDKKNAAFSKKKIYKIIWRDAYSEVDEWHDAQSMDTEDYICETIGYLIEPNPKKNYYTIASTLTCDDYYCCLINIPKAMVISKQRIIIQ
jgi:hypothetical protein